MSGDRPTYAARSKTRVVSVPDVTDRNVVEAVRKLKAIVDMREGLSGSFVDAFVSYRDLLMLGLARNKLGKTQRDSELVFGRSSVDLPVAPLPFLRPEMYEPTQDQATPPRPETVAANIVATTVVVVTWTYKDYFNHGYFEVWRAATNNVKSAVLVGSPVGPYYADPTGTTTTYYYWVRTVSQANIRSNFHAKTGVTP